MNITELAKEWLILRRKGDIEGIEILPRQTSYGLVVWFYFEETGIDLPYFLTVPMVKELLEGKNPKKVKNEYTAQRKQENDGAAGVEEKTEITNQANESTNI